VVKAFQARQEPSERCRTKADARQVPPAIPSAAVRTVRSIAARAVDVIRPSPVEPADDRVDLAVEGRQRHHTTDRDRHPLPRPAGLSHCGEERRARVGAGIAATTRS
jgi:hypothetical protein